jgi:hypothetical protein
VRETTTEESTPGGMDVRYLLLIGNNNRRQHTRRHGGVVFIAHGKQQQKTAHPTAWRCGTYCPGGTVATPRIVSVNTTSTDGAEGWRRFKVNK